MTTLWLVIAAAFAGAVIGFVSGITNERAAGHITSGVTGFVAGALATAAASDSVLHLDAASKIFVLYLVSLLSFYVAGNVLRRQGLVEWLVGRPKQRGFARH